MSSCDSTKLMMKLSFGINDFHTKYFDYKTLSKKDVMSLHLFIRNYKNAIKN
jgi:hypothetical protein